MISAPARPPFPAICRITVRKQPHALLLAALCLALLAVLLPRAAWHATRTAPATGFGATGARGSWPSHTSL